MYLEIDMKLFLHLSCVDLSGKACARTDLYSFCPFAKTSVPIQGIGGAQWLVYVDI